VTEEKKISSSIDVIDNDGNLLGAVCVTPTKERGKKDILLMDENTGTQSFRSITELINMLSRKNVSYKERKRVLDFLSERFIYLEQAIPTDHTNKKNDLKN
jgi:hypothetical protein